MLEVFILGVGMVLRLERDAWLLVQRLRRAINEDLPSPPRLIQAAVYMQVRLTSGS